MNRREFITLLGGAARVAARGARAAAGDAGGGISCPCTPLTDATALPRSTGLEGSRLCRGPERRDRVPLWAGQTDRLPLLVADLLRRQVALIVGNTPSALAAKAATTTVPIVFVTGGDPVRDGLVASLNRPGGNVTGVSFITVELGAKRLGLLRELRPGAARIAVLVDPKWPLTEPFVSEVRAAASAIGQQIDRPPCQHRPRNRDRLYNARPTWGWRAACGLGAFFRPNGNGLSRWRPDTGFPRSIPGAKPSLPAA